MSEVQRRSVLRRIALHKDELMPTFTRDADRFRREYLCDPLDREAVFTREELARLVDRGTIGPFYASSLLCLYYDGQGRISHATDHTRIEDENARLEIYRLKNLADEAAGAYKKAA